MSYGPLSVFTDTIASGASTSAGVYLDRSYKNVLAIIGTMSTGVNLQLQAAIASGAPGQTTAGNYFYMFHPSINSSTVTNNQFIVSAGVGSGGGIVPIPNGLQYMRFVGTGVISGGCSFKVVCSD